MWGLALSISELGLYISSTQVVTALTRLPRLSLAGGLDRVPELRSFWQRLFTLL